MNPLVSILIPAYNSEHWIQDTINSALNQTWPNKEIIIVNDGSTDGTLEIARRFESKIVKILSQQNQGASYARNKALEYAQGDYVQWLDADDLLSPAKISEQLNVAKIENNPHVLFTSSFGTFFFRTREARFNATSLWKDLTPVDWMMAKFNEKIWMNPATWLVSRELIEMAGPWNEKLTLNDDGEYICRIVSMSEKVKFVSCSGCYYRIGNIGSLSSDLKRSDKRLISHYNSIIMQNRYLLNLEDSQRTRAACIKHLQDQYIDFYPERFELVENANKFANELGGSLVPPALKWKYKIIQRTFGWSTAKHASLILPKCKVLIKKHFDKFMAYFENYKCGNSTTYRPPR